MRRYHWAAIVNAILWVAAVVATAVLLRETGQALTLVVILAGLGVTSSLVVTGALGTGAAVSGPRVRVQPVETERAVAPGAAKQLHVGNLSSDTTEDTLRELFAAHGEVLSVNVVRDRYSGEPRGFAFVQMATDEAAQTAIAALNGQEVDGQRIQVDEARPRRPRGDDRRNRDRRSRQGQ